MLDVNVDILQCTIYIIGWIVWCQNWCIKLLKPDCVIHVHHYKTTQKNTLQNKNNISKQNKCAHTLTSVSVAANIRVSPSIILMNCSKPDKK